MKKEMKIAIRIAVLLAFLLVANRVYRFFIHESDLQEHSDLINLIREIPDSASVVYLGESSNFTFGDYDLNTNRISDLTSGYFPDLSFGTVSHGALHAGNFKTLIDQIPDDSKVQTLIVTMNLRSFNASWIDSKLETSLAKSMVLLKKRPPLINRSVLSFKAYDIKSDSERQDRISKHWKKDELFLLSRGRETTVDKWTEEILSLPDSIMERPKRQLGMHYIRTYGFNIDTISNRRIKDFDDIVKAAKGRGWNLVFNLLAENTEKAGELVGEDLVRIMRENSLLLGSRYSRMGALFVNNLEAVQDRSYLDRNWTTEHYDEAGRKIIAKNLAKSMQKIYPSKFSEVQYTDTVKRSFFSNDCEGAVRWFQMGTCSREQAHSGEYSSRINRENAFSVGFTWPVKMIPPGKFNRVDIEFYYYQPFAISKAQIVMEILEGEGKAVWVNKHLSDYGPPTEEWISIKASFDIPPEAINHRLIKLYVWNPGKEPSFVDDILIQFE